MEPNEKLSILSPIVIVIKASNMEEIADLSMSSSRTRLLIANQIEDECLFNLICVI